MATSSKVGTREPYCGQSRPLDDPAVKPRIGPGRDLGGADGTHRPQIDPGFESLRAHGAELLESMRALEQALAAPASGRASAWAEERVNVALGELEADFGEHVELTEGPDGLYQALLATAQHLASAVTKLTDEHPPDQDSIDRLLAGRDKPVDIVDVDPIRGPAQLLGTLSRHRQSAADLVCSTPTNRHRQRPDRPVVIGGVCSNHNDLPRAAPEPRPYAYSACAEGQLPGALHRVGVPGDDPAVGDGVDPVAVGEHPLRPGCHWTRSEPAGQAQLPVGGSR